MRDRTFILLVLIIAAFGVYFALLQPQCIPPCA
jgi:hypothetical protein